MAAKEKRRIPTETVMVEIQSLQGTPLLMHNSRLVNPMDDIVRQMKSLTKKRAKTDEDLRQLMRLEFEGGLYYQEDIGPFLSADMLEACLRDGAKRQKNGKKITAGVLVNEPRVPLEYDGPRGIDALFAEGFHSVMVARVGQVRVTRTRPKFDEWRATFSLQVMTDVIDLGEVEEALMYAGQLIGIGDYRPRYGRFEIVEWTS